MASPILFPFFNFFFDPYKNAQNNTGLFYSDNAEKEFLQADHKTDNDSLNFLRTMRR